MPLMPAPLMQVVDAAGLGLPFAKAYFSATGTITPVAVYQNADFSTPHPSPVLADVNGLFPAIYANPALGLLRLRIIAADGDLADPDTDIDPVDSLFGLGGVTNAYLAPMPATTWKANLTGGEAQPGDYNVDDVTSALRYAAEGAPGTTTFATLAEAVAGTVSNKALTPAGLAARLAIEPTTELDATNGYVILPGGLTIQWGRAGPISIDGFVDIVFPVPFPAHAFNIQHSPSAIGPYSLRMDSWSLRVGDPTLIGVRVYCASSANSTAIYVDWLAIGN